MSKVYDEITREMLAQVEKWGEQNHDPEYWMVILMEEVGEACHEICGKSKNYINHREELIQCAAVVVLAIESFDRNGLNEPAKHCANCGHQLLRFRGTCPACDY